MSKQWQRCIFNKQFQLEIDRPDEKWKLFRRQYSNQLIQEMTSVLMKFPKITKTISHNRYIEDNDVLSVFGHYCPRLKSLVSPLICEEHVMSFFRMYGHKLEELRWSGCYSIVFEEDKQYLEYCPNLKTVGPPSNNLLVTFKTNSCDWFVHDTWYFGKYLSEVMFSDNGLNVKHINDNCGFLRLEFME